MKETKGSGAFLELGEMGAVLLTGKMATTRRMLLRVKGAAGCYALGAYGTWEAPSGLALTAGGAP